MNENQARITANTVIAAAAIGAAVIVVRSPALRRLLWRLVKDYARGPLAVAAAATVRSAWDASGQTEGTVRFAGPRT
jgi:hypothetical protein